MTAQLKPDLGRPAQPAPRAPRARLLGWGRRALQWTPVWVPLVFLGQLLWLGFLPARAEAARLDRVEAEVHERAAGLLQERNELGARAHMLADEVFRERVRRSLVDPAREPLTLERARTDRP